MPNPDAQQIMSWESNVVQEDTPDALLKQFEGTEEIASAGQSADVDKAIREKQRHKLQEAHKRHGT